MKRLAAVLLVLMGISLTACAPAKPSEPAVKTVVTPMVAERAQEITITGTGLGSTAGVITIGGATADIISWSDTEARASVAGETPHAWQDLVIENAAGKASTVHDFFVGAKYSESADGLNTFLAALNADTALLLGPGIYELSPATPDLDFRRNGLYGSGSSGDTVVRTPGYMRWIAGSGQDVVIANLTIEADILEISNAGVEVPQVGTRLVTIHNAALVIGNLVSLLANELGAGVILANVTLDAPSATLNVHAKRDLHVTSSNLTTDVSQLTSAYGAFVIEDSYLAASSSMNMLAESMSSEVGRFVNNNVSVTGDGGPTFQMELTSGTCVIDDNVFEVVDTNGDSPVDFSIECGATLGVEPHAFTRNTVIVLGDGTELDPAKVRLWGGTADFSGNTITTDRGFMFSPWSTKGGSIADNTSELGTQGLTLWGNSSSVITMNGGNRVNTEGLASANDYGLYASVGSLIISGDNQFTDSGTEAGTAVRLNSSQHVIQNIELTGAVFKGFERAFIMNSPAIYAGLNVRANNNNFDFPITAAPQVAQLYGGVPADVINLDDNKWGDNIDVATVRSFIAPAVNLVTLDTIKAVWP